MDYLKLLKKHKRDADRSKALWSGTTPVLQCAYHRNCGEFCFHVRQLNWDKYPAVPNLIFYFFIVVLSMLCTYCRMAYNWSRNSLEEEQGRH